MLSACQQPPNSLEFSGATMGTTYAVTLTAPPPELDAARAQARVEQVLERVNDQMSTYRADSELSQVNNSEAGVWTPVSPALLKLLKRASDIGARTQGSFDITVGPLVNLWGFGPDPDRDDIPEQAQIDQRLARVGLDKLILRDTPPSVKKRQAGVYVDLSAIAKGYGVDQVALALKGLGATDFLVEIGGELYAKGMNARGQPWQVAVERPSAGQRSIEMVVNLQDMGMATSGDYRNYFEVDGQRYSHTIDPHIGRPVTHDLRAVTVLAPSTAYADAMATALLVMGPQAGLGFAKREKLAALFISGTDDAYTKTMTTQFNARVSNNP